MSPYPEREDAGPAATTAGAVTSYPQAIFKEVVPENHSPIVPLANQPSGPNARP
jgi:hypothetical protein